MGIFSGCLIVSDIDGTLYWKGKIPKRNLEAIEYFKSEGGIFALATGRVVNGARHIHKEARSNAPLVASHGGQIFDLNKNEFLYQKFLDTRCYNILPLILKEFPHIGADIFNGLDIYEYRSNFGTRWHAEYEKLTFAKVPEDITAVPWTKVLFAVDDADTLERLNAFCQSLNIDYCKFMKTSNQENARYCEMVPLGVDKGTALKELKKLCGAKKAYGIGDYYNDVELIRDADLGATTAEAPDDIKELAGYVTGPCSNGAVADFIQKIKSL